MLNYHRERFRKLTFRALAWTYPVSKLQRRVKLIIKTMVVLNAIGIDATFVRISL